jgi:hypothetical protein
MAAGATNRNPVAAALFAKHGKDPPPTSGCPESLAGHLCAMLYSATIE